MKRRMIFAMAAMMAVSVAACGQNTETSAVTSTVSESSTVNTEQAEEAESTEGMTDRQNEADAVRYTYQLSSERVYDSAYTDDGSQLLVKSEYDLLSLDTAEDDSGNTGTINIILDEINRDTKEQTADFVSENKDGARKQYEDQGGDFVWNYEKDSDLTVERADSRVLSVVREEYTFMGGAHGYDQTTAYCYDAQTGERLKLSDVLTSTDGLAKVLAGELIRNNPPERFDLFGTDELEGTIQELLDGNEYYSGDNDAHYVTWYVGHDGISFVFNQYEIASYAAGKFYVTLTAEDYPDLVNSYYAKGPEDYITRVDLYETADIDGKDLTIDPVYDEYSTLTDVTVKLGDSLRKISDIGGDGISGYLVRAGGKNYLYLNVNMANDWEQIYIVDLNSDDLAVSDFDEGVYDSVLMDPEHMVLGTRSRVMSTVQIARSYRVGDHGVPQPDEEMYRVTGRPDLWLTLKQNAEFNVLEDQDSDTTHKEVFSKGTKFRLWRTDNKSIMDCVTEDGRYVRFTVNTDEYPQVIDGQYDLEDLFDGTVFAG